jgi:hypothetical protein
MFGSRAYGSVGYSGSTGGLRGFGVRVALESSYELEEHYVWQFDKIYLNQGFNLDQEWHLDSALSQFWEIECEWASGGEKMLFRELDLEMIIDWVDEAIVEYGEYIDLMQLIPDKFHPVLEVL